jgi:fatty acid desaturase
VERIPVLTPDAAAAVVDRASRVDGLAPGSLLAAATARLLADARDAPLLRTILLASVTCVPFAAWLFAHPAFSPWVGACYLAMLFAFFVPRLAIVLHLATHRRVFAKRNGVLELWSAGVVFPLAGHSPASYYTHHVAMHHVEENAPTDLSSTERYRRDDWRHFVVYFLRFFLLTICDLPRYLYRKGRGGLARRVLAGELAWLLAAAGLAWLNWRAAVVVLVLPLVLVRFGLMAGNWAQHAFVDPLDPDNAFRNTTTCLDGPYNRICFNDGYHVEHHLAPARHWSELPRAFERSAAAYAANGAIVFEGIDFMGVWACLMSRRLDRLARHFVPPSGTAQTQAEIVDLLSSRLSPVQR